MKMKAITLKRTSRQAVPMTTKGNTMTMECKTDERKRNKNLSCGWNLYSTTIDKIGKNFINSKIFIQQKKNYRTLKKEFFFIVKKIKLNLLQEGLFVFIHFYIFRF